MIESLIPRRQTTALERYDIPTKSTPILFLSVWVKIAVFHGYLHDVLVFTMLLPQVLHVRFLLVEETGTCHMAIVRVWHGTAPAL